MAGRALWKCGSRRLLSCTRAGASALSHVVAAIAISGLPSREDHHMILSTLAA
jgi:hypothetical protein